LAHQDRLNIAVFVDFDNIEIGVKSTLNEHFDVGPILEAIKERGEIVSKIAYADWTRAGDYSRHLTQHAIRLVQRNLTPGGDKNGADINMALDALEMAFTHQHINAYVIVGGDSDFLSLVEKLKQYDKKVFVVGGRAFTSIILQRNCHEFIAYENLTRSRRSSPESKGGRPQQQPAASSGNAPIPQAIPLVRRALKILADREVSPQTGLLKSTLLQLDSTFSERTYGASSFLDFVEKLAKEGLVTLKHSGRSVMVELNDGFQEGLAPAAQDPPAVHEPAEAVPVAQPFRPAAEVVEESAPPAPPAPSAPAQPAGHNAEGVAKAEQILAAATQARWPMYLRNVKQILRQAAGGFDERQYGFGGLMDLLRALQRENFVRVERDRRGGLRVFQGAALQQKAQAARLPQPDVESEIVDETPIVDAQPGEPVDTTEPIEVEAMAPPPEVVDTTAELLGRATPKPKRARAAAPRAPRAAAKGTKKTGTRKATRSKKTADTGNSD
jgi:uncharacterized LabA/DUF88 family protein